MIIDNDNYITDNESQEIYENIQLKPKLYSANFNIVLKGKYELGYNYSYNSSFVNDYNLPYRGSYNSVYF